VEAEEEAAAGCEELPRDVMHLGIASYEVGEIRLQRGDLAGAQEAFERAHELGRSPQPGLALVRLAQGQGKAAMSMIEAALEDERYACGSDASAPTAAGPPARQRVRPPCR
jgi:glutathione S-transferase